MSVVEQQQGPTCQACGGALPSLRGGRKWCDAEECQRKNRQAIRARRRAKIQAEREARGEPAQRTEAAAGGGPDRAAGLRADRAQMRRRPPRHGPAPQLPRQGTQATHHPGHRLDRRPAATLAGRTRRPARPAAVPDPPRPLAQPRRARAPTRQNTATPPPATVHPSRPRRSRCTCCATPPRCGCCTPASTPRS